MSWRHRISRVVLMVLTALPVSGTVCVMLCDSAASRAQSHHAAGQICDEQASPSSGAQLRGASGHDCGDHEAAVRATTATRADSVPRPTLLATVAVHDTTGSLVGADDVLDCRIPPGSPPPTASLLVLRV